LSVIGEITPPVLYGLCVLVVSLKQQREIEHRVSLVRRGVQRPAQTIDSQLLIGPVRPAGQKGYTSPGHAAEPPVKLLSAELSNSIVIASIVAHGDTPLSSGSAETRLILPPPLSR
jgi:hypothetical protein